MIYYSPIPIPTHQQIATDPSPDYLVERALLPAKRNEGQFATSTYVVISHGSPPGKQETARWVVHVGITTYFIIFLVARYLL